MLRHMDTGETSDPTRCCNSQMLQVASAERPHGDRVTVMACEACGRIDSLGFASSPWWVGARARSFAELRKEAFQSAGLEASPATAVLDQATLRVIFC